MAKTILQIPIPLPYGRDWKVKLPFGAKPLHVEAPRDEPHVWVLVNPGESKVNYGFRVLLTEDTVPNDSGEYIGTWLLHGEMGWQAYHLFFLGVV